MAVYDADNSSLLDQLAVSFAKDFVRDLSKSSIKKINLCGGELEMLLLVQNRMTRYFEEKSVDVSVGLGSEGYVIDVGFFLRGQKNSPNMCQYL